MKDFNWKKIADTEMELGAIWIPRGAFIERDGLVRREVRIVPGDKIAVIDGELVSCATMQPTHKIISCVGTLYSKNLKFITVGLEDNQPLIVRV